MLVLALVLILCGLVTLVALAQFLCIYLVPLAIGLVVSRWAYLAGGGLVGAAVAFAVAFTLTIVGIRVAISLPSPWLRAGVLLAVGAPSATLAYVLMAALTSCLVPSLVWRILFDAAAAAAAGIAAMRCYLQP